MKTAEASVGAPWFMRRSSSAFGSSKIHNEHLTKLAIVYVRQSSPQQVVEHRESRERQYELADFAHTLGWPRERVLVIDQDQGQSGAQADNRDGFQQLLAEVTMDHVGIVLGLEMSRLARSSKDWHHLLEVCGIFGTLLGDQDGVYTASDPNDRLLLGLKGTMSEVELHTMRNRLQRGALHKAERGELFYSVPFGYVILPNGQVAQDPDDEARAVVQLIFDKFDEMGAIYSTFHWLVRHDIKLPMRAQRGCQKGELTWRRPTFFNVRDALHHPIYAGAYAFGRRASDRKSPYASGRGRRKLVSQPMDEWKVLIQDHLPSYISWDQYLKNQARIRQNRRGNGHSGHAGKGMALLSGILECGTCGRKLHVSYPSSHAPHYQCARHLMEAAEQTCYGLASQPIDELVTGQVFKALEPAALELSTQALADAEQERARLERHWQQRLERARYEIDLAQRRYRNVDPENRLVARALETQWEEALRNERTIQEEYERFQRASPAKIRQEDLEQIALLSSHIPALWQGEGTTHADRKQIIRCLVDRVVVHVERDSQYVETTIHWKGGYHSQHEMIRPVSSYAQLRDFEALVERVALLRRQGHTAPEIASQLNEEGFTPPKRREFDGPLVHRLLKRCGLIGNERSRDELLGEHEWWIADLARKLEMSRMKLRDWAVRGWIHSRKTSIQGYRIVWADDDEIVRLRGLLAQSQRGTNSYTPDLTTPNPRH